MAAIETKGTLNANNQALGSVRNVSRTGIGLETGQPPMVGQGVVLRIAYGDDLHELKTRTTRVVPGKGNFYEVGLDWTSCSGTELAFLDEVLRAVEKQPLA
ncbi:MAG: PilZ domain-containing protein [Planctomycetes bacterium]|nr:PilZ domain-containing protein [Planctomycetota bacterium]